MTVNNERRKVWVQVLNMLEESASQAEFDICLDLAVSFLRHGFLDEKAANVLAGEWNGAWYSRWHVSATGIPSCPPDNNTVESMQNSLRRAIGTRPQPTTFVLPHGIQKLCERERSDRRDNGSLREDRLPWFWNANSFSGAKSLIEEHKSSKQCVICLSSEPGNIEYAVRSRDGSHSIGENDVNCRKDALVGNVAVDEYKLQEEECEGLDLEHRVAMVQSRLEMFKSRYRSVHIVQMAQPYGAITGIDGWRCECKAYWDDAQCRHVLVAAHMEGEIDLQKRRCNAGSGRRLQRRPSRLVQPEQGNATTTQQRGKQPSKLGHGDGDNAVPVVSKACKSKTRNTRPTDYLRGRGKQKTGKGKQTKKKN